MSGEPSQERLFIPSRFPPQHLAIWLVTPKAFARTLAIAGCVGRVIRRDSTFMPLHAGETGIGVYLGPKQIKYTLNLLGISPRSTKYWPHFAEKVEELNIGHRCGPQALTLFIDIFQTPCPNPACGKEMLVQPRRKGALSEHPRVLYSDTLGALSEHQSVPESGDANGMKEGDEGLESLNSSSLEANEGQGQDVSSGLEPARVFKNRAEDERQSWCLRCQRYGPEHPGEHVREWTTMRRGAW